MSVGSREQVMRVTPGLKRVVKRRQIGTVVYQEEEEDEEEKEERGNKFKRVTPLTLDWMRTKRVTGQNVLYFRKEA